MKRWILGILALLLGGMAAFMAYTLYLTSGEPGGNHAGIVMVKVADAAGFVAALALLYHALKPVRLK